MRRFLFLILISYSFSSYSMDNQATWDDAFNSVCPSCSTILNHMVLMSGNAVSIDDKIAIADSSPDYAFRLALIHVSPDTYKTLSFYEESTGKMLSVDEANVFLRSDTYKTLHDYIAGNATHNE